MANEGRICPQCGYGRQPKDLAPDYECPRCGIIYAKYVPPKPKEPVAAAGENPPDPPRGEGATRRENPAGGGPSKGGGDELQPASLLRRALAGIYTGSLVVLLIVPLKLFVYAAFRMVNPPASIQTWAVASSFRSWEVAYYAIMGVIILGAFLHRTLITGASWGQEKFGVTVRSAYNLKEEPILQARLLRLAGVAIAICTYPVTLAGFLYGLYAKANLPGIPDRISSTRQYETGKPAIPFRSAVNRAFMPFSIALILQIAIVGPLSAWMINGYLKEAARRANPAVSRGPAKVRPPNPEMQAIIAERRGAAARQSAFAMLSNLERRHRQERGSYTDDLEALVTRYSTTAQGSLNAILSGIKDGTIRARRTAQGVELLVEVTPGFWQQQELRE